MFGGYRVLSGVVCGDFVEGVDGIWIGFKFSLRGCLEAIDEQLPDNDQTSFGRGSHLLLVLLFLLLMC